MKLDNELSPKFTNSIWGCSGIKFYFRKKPNRDKTDRLLEIIYEI